MVQPQETHRAPLRTVIESYVSVTGATYAARAGDRLIGVNRAGTVTITLPSAQLRAGRTYTVKDESGAAASNNITVATEGSETIDGLATDVISDNYGAKHYYSNGSNWFEVPLLPATAVAHSATTGQGTDDHHAEAHTTAHASGGADATKLDDLSAPDDNTDLNFSTVAHGLVPKGPNDGTFLGADGTWSAPSGGPSQATQAAIEAETNEDTYAPPDLLHFGPWALKAWVQFHHTATVDASYNITGVSNDATGDYTITLATDFAAALYARFVGNGEEDRQLSVDPGNAPAAGTLQVIHTVSSNASTINIGATAALANSIGFAGDQ